MHTASLVPAVPDPTVVYPATLHGTHAAPSAEYDPAAHAGQTAAEAPAKPGRSDACPALHAEHAPPESSPVAEYVPGVQSEQSARDVTLTSLPLYEAVDGRAMEVRPLVLAKA